MKKNGDNKAALDITHAYTLCCLYKPHLLVQSAHAAQMQAAPLSASFDLTFPFFFACLTKAKAKADAAKAILWHVMDGIIASTSSNLHSHYSPVPTASHQSPPGPVLVLLLHYSLAGRLSSGLLSKFLHCST